MAIQVLDFSHFLFNNSPSTNFWLIQDNFFLRRDRQLLNFYDLKTFNKAALFVLVITAAENISGEKHKLQLPSLT